MKKLISTTIIATILLSLTSCGSDDNGLYKVGMTTDAGTIDDKSFNQGSWEGIKRYEEENGTIEARFIQPSGEAEEDYLAAYANLVDVGYQTIISPGFKFETAVYKAQSLYPDVNFVILDGNPHGGDFVPSIAENTKSIFFADQEAGFYAGVIAALNSDTGSVAYIGGSKIPAVQRFGMGYVSGVAYANEVYDTNTLVTNYIYQGTFTDAAAGKALAGSFYDEGADVVFAAAGAVGTGVIDEAKTRRTNNEDVWVIGVDVDQYDDGLIADGSSVVLTSAIKDLGVATYTSIDEILNNEFPGGQSIILDSTNNGVGIPKENPNLSEETLKYYNETFDAIVAGEVVVPSSIEELEAFLVEYNYEGTEKIEY